MNPRYSIIPAGAVTDPRIEPRDLQVLCLLGRHIDNLGWCRRSQVKMSRELHCARSTLQASLDRLIDASWVEKRAEPKSAKGDSAHSYRVRLDMNESDSFYDEMVKDRGRGRNPQKPSKSGPNPADLSAPSSGTDKSTGDSTQESANQAIVQDQPADLSAPSRHPVPIYASAPLTSPVEREEERERAREAPEKDQKAGELTADQAWAALTKIWPDISLQNGALAQSALERLTGHERKVAIDRVPDFLALHREKQGKAKLPFLHNYLGEKHRWQALPQAKPTAAATVERKVIGAFDRAWWWLFFDLVHRFGSALLDMRSRESAQVRKHVDLARHGVGWSVGAARLEEIEAAGMRLTQIPVDGREFAAWATALRGNGVDLPRPDKAGWIFVPAQWPPDESERDATLREAETAIMGEETR